MKSKSLTFYFSMKKWLALMFAVSFFASCTWTSDKAVNSIHQLDSVSRIAGGEALQPSQFRSLGQVSDAAGDWCSAVLVGPQAVLTAAHCCVGYLQDSGLSFQDADNHSTDAVPLTKIVSPKYGHYENLPADHSYLIRYPEFNLSHDACLIALKEPALVAPMTINLDSSKISKTKAIVAGAGLVNYTTPWQVYRAVGEMTIEEFSDEGLRAFNPTTYMMPGDSGSGIFMMDENHHVQQIGVTSTSISGFCWNFDSTNGKGLGGVYAKVSSDALVEVGQPATPTAACFKEAPANLPADQVFIPSGTSGFYNTSAPEFRVLLDNFTKANSLGVCGFNLNCAPVSF